jgi:hypothetical protein
MALDLPRLHVTTEGFDPVVAAACPEIGPELAERLVALDRGTVPSGVVYRMLGLGPRTWVVGQRRGDDTVWRLIAPEDAERLGGNPAWLWTTEAWFDPTFGRDARARTPTPVPLRQLVRLMAPLGGRNRKTVKALAAVIAALRARPGGGPPVALVVERELLASASHPARWFVLGVLAVLPLGWRDTLRVSIGESNPDPGQYDLVVSPTPPTGFVVVDAAEPPEDSEDLVAYYVRNRLTEDDPEALEAASYMFSGDGDRWGDGIAALIRDGLHGLSEVTDELIDQDPDRAVAALTARLRAGATLDATLLDQLVRLTVKTSSDGPWLAIARRSGLQRADALEALLAVGRSLRPPAGLLRALTAAHPDDAPVKSWVPTLLHWLAEGVDPDGVSHAMVATVGEGATAEERLSLLAELVERLTRAGRADRIAEVLGSELARSLVRDGRGADLVRLWAKVPNPRLDQLRGFAEAMVAGAAPEDAGARIADLFAQVQHQEALAVAVLEAWLARADAIRGDDPVFAAVRETPYLRRWTELVLQAPERPVDPAVWARVADVLADGAEDPRNALLSLAQVPVDPANDKALALLQDALGTATFPDPALATAAEMLAHTPSASPIWGWIAVTAATPDTWDDETVDATVVEFCAGQPAAAVLAAAKLAMERLGAAAEWEPLDHARWVVRLALAPPGMANVPLIQALLRGIRARPDAVAFMTGLLRPMLDLPPDHDASIALLEEMPDSGWKGPLLLDVIESVGRINIPLSMRRTLVAMAEQV